MRPLTVGPSALMLRSVSGHVFGASFSASDDYGSVHSQSSSEKSAFVSSQATCTVYQASVSTYYLHSSPLTSNSIAAVESLPSSYSEATMPDFDAFVSAFGTHVTSNVEMGAREGYRLKCLRAPTSRCAHKISMFVQRLQPMASVWRLIPR